VFLPVAEASIPDYSRRYYLVFVVGKIEENCHLCQRGVTLDETFPGAPQAAHQLLSEA
jgi:hypothetical protein